MIMLNLECERSVLPEALLKKILKQVSLNLKLKKKVNVSLAFVSSSVIRRLNRQYRGKDKATDVLSFPFNDSEEAGEVIICLNKAKTQAKLYKHSVEEELIILFVHGLLHLFKFNHINKKDAEKMFSLQEKILKSLNIDWSFPEYG